ncbi:hypothetical protein [Acinetobacter radioresistens]|uniref:hypothetical protein n=1 Tax=Acinetobacter radioresistens TaxID=40216 RepID=UPI0035CCDF70
MLPKTDIEPAYTYTYPSRKAYVDESKSTLANGSIFDPSKTGADYGIVDPKQTKPVASPPTDNGGG